MSDIKAVHDVRLIGVAETGLWLPARAKPGDAGFDLYCQVETVCRPGEFVDIPCGVAVEFPSGWWGLLTGRSSTLRKRGLLVAQAVIDNGYRGPLFAGVWNLRDSSVTVGPGERIAQLIPVQAFPDSVIAAVGLGWSERGDSGFGSTGR